MGPTGGTGGGGWGWVVVPVPVVPPPVPAVEPVPPLDVVPDDIGTVATPGGAAGRSQLLL